MALDDAQSTLQLAARLTVTGFRGVDEASVELTPVTIVTGRNNSGKSSLLEALAIAASAAAGFRDWLGSDTIRYIVDGKLLGRPPRLIRSGHGEAYVRFDHPLVRVKVVIRKPRDIREEARRLACIAARSINTFMARFCVLGAVENNLLLKRRVLDRAYALLGDAINSMRLLCSRSGAQLPGSMAETVAEALLEALTRAASRVVRESVEVEVSGGGEGRWGFGRIYYPGAGRWKYLTKDVRVTVSGALGEVVNRLAEALQPVELNSRGLVDCLSGVLHDALKKAIWEGYGSPETAGKPIRVYTLFHRVLPGNRDGLAKSLTRVIQTLHSLGLLETYNSLIKNVPGLGVSDPFIEEGEVWFRASGGRVPASLLGDGTLHLLLLFAGLALAKGGNVVLIYEEPETGLHPGYMIVFAQQLAQVPRENPGVLIVLSTHSLELIRYIADAAREAGVAELLTTVLMDNGGVFSTFRGEEVVEASELEIDLRGI